jgi:hypothetical protein
MRDATRGRVRLFRVSRSFLILDSRFGNNRACRVTTQTECLFYGLAIAAAAVGLIE